MPAVISFSPEITQPFFTFQDHLREARRKVPAEPSQHTDCGSYIAAASSAPLKKLLGIPEEWQVLFEPPAPKASAHTDFMPLVHPETAEILAHHDNALRLWDVTAVLPCMEMDFNHSSAFYFGTCQGFGIPDGPQVTVFDPQRFEPSGNYHSDQFSGVRWSAGINLQMLWITGRIAEDLNRIGMETLRRDMLYKEAVLNHAVSAHPLLAPVTERSRRTPALLVVQANASHADGLAGHLQRFRLLSGRRNSRFTFTNFPTHSRESAEWLADCLSAFNGNA